MPLRLSNLIHNSNLHGIYYFYNSSICFNRDILIDDITNQHIIKISGVIFNIYNPPKLTWSIFSLRDDNIYCPSKYSYQQGPPDSNLISHWIKSTSTTRSPEMLLKSYYLSLKYDVIHLINQVKWDGLFCERSYFTNSGNWSPFLINPCPDKMIHLLEDEINFFMSWKKIIHQESISLKFCHSGELLLPSQIDFIFNEEVMLIMNILSNWNKDLWDCICQFLPLDTNLSQIWRLEILFNYPDRKSLIKHFQESNVLNYNFQVPI